MILMIDTAMVPEDDPGIVLMKGLRTLREQKLLLDYTIEVGDQEFKVHKVIMASVSDYFKAMLTGGMLEYKTNRVRLQGVDVVTASNLIDLIYEVSPMDIMGLNWQFNV